MWNIPCFVTNIIEFCLQISMEKRQTADCTWRFDDLRKHWRIGIVRWACSINSKNPIRSNRFACTEKYNQSVTEIHLQISLKKWTHVRYNISILKVYLLLVISSFSWWKQRSIKYSPQNAEPKWLQTFDVKLHCW